MGIISGLFRSRSKPMTDSTVGGAYRFLFGGSTSGKMVTELSYMQMTAVYSFVRILSEAVAGLPLHLYKYNDSGGTGCKIEKIEWSWMMDHGEVLLSNLEKVHTTEMGFDRIKKHLGIDIADVVFFVIT